MSPALARFLSAYQQLDNQHLHLLTEIYSEEVIFIDPLHRINGIAALKRYFTAMYQHLQAIEFDYQDVDEQSEQAFVQWQMRFRHPRLAAGAWVTVEGITVLRFNDAGKACYHRDYFDLGAMLYEQLPLLGRLVGFIKRRAGQ